MWWDRQIRKIGKIEFEMRWKIKCKYITTLKNLDWYSIILKCTTKRAIF